MSQTVETRFFGADAITKQNWHRKSKYHSALQHGEPDADFMRDFPDEAPAALFQGHWGMAKVADVCRGSILSEYFHPVSCFYSDAAWPKGMSKFNTRAGASTDTVEYYNRINSDLKTLGKPAYVLAGTMAKKLFTNAAYEYPIILNGATITCFVFNLIPSRAITESTAENLLWEMAGAYGVLGDFSAGLGRTAVAAVARKKQFVLGEINGRAVAAVASLFDMRRITKENLSWH